MLELFLKYGKGSVVNDVIDEMVRLNWLMEFMFFLIIKYFICIFDDVWLFIIVIFGKIVF